MSRNDKEIRKMDKTQKKELSLKNVGGLLKIGE